MESSEIDAFLRFALEHYEVDPARIYLTGLSCGAIGLWNYLREHAGELVAAAVPIAGHGLAAIDERGCDLGTVPIWAFHGESDSTVFVHGDVYPISVLRSCTDPAALDARITVYPHVGHGGWSQTYSGSAGHDIYSWLLSHQK
jgi:predicted peptidase